MKAIVLSGGGSKGSYQIGVWKALKKLNIEYDLVTGTSVGALNGALMVQNKFHNAIKLWKNINMELLFGENATDSNKTKDILNMYRINFFKNGGMDVKKLEDIIDKYIDNECFYESKIDFGLVTINVSGKKALQLRKNKIPREKLVDYLMASASCYPAFQAKDIDGKKFVDGGMFDNLPINLAIDMGADEIIAIDLCAPGFKQKVKDKNINITTIKPNNKLTNFLKFEEEGSIKNIKFGYNDTMKLFNKYYGKKFTFKKRNFEKVMNEYNEIFIHKFNDIFNTSKISDIFKLNDLDLSNLLLRTSEDIGSILELDETKIYSYKRFCKICIKKIKKNYRNNSIKTKKSDSVFSLYNKIKTKDYKYLKTKAILTPKEFLCALLLYVVSEV